MEGKTLEMKSVKSRKNSLKRRLNQQQQLQKNKKTKTKKTVN